MAGSETPNHTQVETEKSQISKVSLKNKAIQRIKKMFFKEKKAPLELPMVERPQIPAESGLAKLLGDLKEHSSTTNEPGKLHNSADVAGVIENNYFKFLQLTDTIPGPKLAQKVQTALNDGNIRVITALAQEEYRQVMNKLKDKPTSSEDEMVNKKIHDKATELLKIKSIAGVMGVNTQGIVQASAKGSDQYWLNVLNPQVEETPAVEEEPALMTPKRDQDIEEALGAGFNGKSLEGENKEE